MSRFIVLALLLAVSMPAAAADAPQPAAAPAASKTADKSKDKPAAKPKGPPSKVTAQQAMDVRTTKAKFMSAVGSCARPEDCDPNSPKRNTELVTLLIRSEEAFVTACLQCATDKACEEERAKIRAGKGRFGYNACMQEDPAKDGKPKAAPASTSDAKKPPK